MSSIDNTKSALAAHVESLELHARLQYLENLCVGLKSRMVVFINPQTQHDGTDDIFQWAKNLLQSQPIPDDYFEWSMNLMLSGFSEEAHPEIMGKMVQLLGPMDRNLARQNNTVQEYTDEQFDLLYTQMQLWVAMHEPRRGGLN